LAERPRVRWESLPVLKTPRATLRELAPADAPSLLAMLGTDEVQAFMPPGPNTAEAFLHFIRWARRQRRIGRYISFGVVPDGFEYAVGVFQFWPLEPWFRTAEWGFALGRPFWGTGLFMECAEAVLDFAMDTLGIYRLEARAAVENVRGNGALQKLGASREGVLRNCFQCGGQPRDHVMWALLRDDWRRIRSRRLTGDVSGDATVVGNALAQAGRRQPKPGRVDPLEILIRSADEGVFGSPEDLVDVAR
jgi:RimJ/RimL family protein N-acetyltransferase